MLELLAQLDRDQALAKGYWNLAMIILVTLLTVVFLVAMFTLRRWKRRQLKSIEKDRADRRAGQTPERVDAWQASSERYVDHDKLPEDDLFARDEDAHEQGDGQAEPDDRDPFGLFDDKPYQEPEDEDDDDDLDEDWDADDDEDKPF